MTEFDRCFESCTTDIALGTIFGVLLAIVLIVFVASGSQGGNKKL